MSNSVMTAPRPAKYSQKVVPAEGLPPEKELELKADGYVLQTNETSVEQRKSFQRAEDVEQHASQYWEKYLLDEGEKLVESNKEYIVGQGALSTDPRMQMRTELSREAIVDTLKT